MNKQSLTFIFMFIILAAIVVGSVFFIVGREQRTADFAPTGTVSGSDQGSTNLTESAFYTESAKNATSGAAVAP
jgi:hypothetical protein